MDQAAWQWVVVATTVVLAIAVNVPWRRLFARKPVRQLQIVHDEECRYQPDHGQGFRIRIINPTAFPLEQVRVQVKSLRTDPPDDTQRQKAANQVIDAFLTARRGEPTEGTKAEDAFPLAGHGGSRLVDLVNIYEDGRIFVLVSGGIWKRGKWHRKDAWLPDGLYYITLRADSEWRYYDEATFRFGIADGAIVFEPIKQS